jgi:aminoglycoside 3-N-acetyltransferase I
MRYQAFEVRILQANDVSLMRELNAVFGRAFNESEKYGGEPPDDSYLAALLSRPNIVVIVAVEEGVVVGGLVTYELEKFESRTSEFYIYDLAVEERRRRRGIATACIQRLQAIAAERGAWAIFVQADRDDDDAIALYQKLGRREDVLHFDIPPAASPAQESCRPCENSAVHSALPKFRGL